VAVDVIRTNIVLVGGGGAGLRAAMAALDAHDGLEVACVSKLYPMRSHTVSAEGGAAASVGPDDSLDLHAYDTLKGSDFLADQDAVEQFVQEAPLELTQLEHWGCPWNREADGRVAVRFFGGMSVKRTWFASDKTGFHMLHALFQTSLKYERIRWLHEYFATRLLVDNGRCCGVAALDMRTGRVTAVLGQAVILCTGGAGKIFPFTTNAAAKRVVNPRRGAWVAARVSSAFRSMVALGSFARAGGRSWRLSSRAISRLARSSSPW